MTKICLVIPCFNEEFRLGKMEFIEFYKENLDFYFLFVNDGSTDFTSEIVNQIKLRREDRIDIIELGVNKGKGEAVRKGVLHAMTWNKFSIIGFLDADLSIPLEEAKRLVSYFDDRKVQFVFGSRIQIVGTEIKKKFYRHIIGRIFATLISSLLKIRVYDTQCGIKFFRPNIVHKLFKEKFDSRWIFDVEIFCRFLDVYKDEDINLVAKEIPLNKCLHVDGSKININHFVKVPIDLMRIYFKNKR